MVFRRVSKRKAGKRMQGRRPGKRAYKTNSLVGKSLNPIPQRTIVKMKYCQSVNASLVGGVGAYQFNLNSIFKPDRTGLGGHQPYARDNFELLYNRYRVISCRYAIAVASSTGFTTQVVALPANEVLTMTNASEARENPRARFAIQSANAPLKMLKGNVYIPSLVGRTKAQYMADDRYQAQMTTSPAELAVLNIFTGLISDVAITDSTAINVTLEYVVEFFDVKHLAQS